MNENERKREERSSTHRRRRGVVGVVRETEGERGGVTGVLPATRRREDELGERVRVDLVGGVLGTDLEVLWGVRSWF